MLQSRLEDAVGRGELTIDEYDDLCARVWADDVGDDSPELDAVAGRLERIESARGRGAGGVGGVGGGTGAEVARRAGDLIGTTPESQRQGGKAVVFTERKFNGRWAPKALTTWWAVMGDVKLDLRDADWPAERIVLDVQSVMAEVKVIVPPGTAVIDETTSIMSEVSVKTSRKAPANGLTVVLDGVLVMAEVTVRDR